MYKGKKKINEKAIWEKYYILVDSQQIPEKKGKKKERVRRNKSYLQGIESKQIYSRYHQGLNKEALKKRYQAAELFTWWGSNCPTWEVLATCMENRCYHFYLMWQQEVGEDRNSVLSLML